MIVTSPQEVALLDSRKAVVFSRMVQVPVIGIVENMSGVKCPHCGKEIDRFKVGGGEKAVRELRIPFLGRIPLDPDIVKDCDGGANPSLRPSRIPPQPKPWGKSPTGSRILLIITAKGH